jgi:membrane-bound hydrogenase subunit beta
MSAVQFAEEVGGALVGAFPALEGRVRIQRQRRIWVDVELAQFRAVFDHAVDGLGFTIMCVITGLDEGEELGFLYHIANLSGTILSLHTKASKSEPVIHSVSDRFPAAHIYERELVDLLGARVEGLPPGNRYPLSDDWPEGQYPLRKDWKMDTGELPGEGV